MNFAMWVACWHPTFQIAQVLKSPRALGQTGKSGRCCWCRLRVSGALQCVQELQSSDVHHPFFYTTSHAPDEFFSQDFAGLSVCWSMIQLRKACRARAQDRMLPLKLIRTTQAPRADCVAWLCWIGSWVFLLRQSRQSGTPVWMQTMQQILSIKVRRC